MTDVTQSKTAEEMAAFELETGMPWHAACTMAFDREHRFEENGGNLELLERAFNFGLTYSGAAELLASFSMADLIGALLNFVESAVEAIIEPDPAQRAYKALYDEAGFEVLA